jgi:hypothetical protein
MGELSGNRLKERSSDDLCAKIPDSKDYCSPKNILALGIGVRKFSSYLLCTRAGCFFPKHPALSTTGKAFLCIHSSSNTRGCFSTPLFKGKDTRYF